VAETKVVKASISHEDLLRIIDLCRVVETRGTDPFEIDVRRSIETLKKHLPKWTLLDDLLLDVEALNQIASIIHLQKKWIAYRASSLYVDPLVVELKIRLASQENLAEALEKSWHPIVSLQHITPQRLTDAMDYWNTLLPLNERLASSPNGEPLEPGSFDIQELVKMQIVSEKEFRDRLNSLLKELNEKITRSEEGRIRYEDFIYVSDFKETILRAYLTAFLISEGESFLQVNPLEEEAYLTLRQPEGASKTSTGSKVVAIDHGEWAIYMERDSQV
jgi:hypothetical protein